VEGNERFLKSPRRARFTRDGLVVTLVFASMIVAALSAQQGRTIESQRNIIRTLFLDSKELSALKMRDLQQQKRAAAANNQGNQVQQEKNVPQSTCADSDKKSGKSCDVPQSAAPAQAVPDKNRTPEKSDDDTSLPNPQRLLHSI
jgi:hypothetical protein